ncbi:MAG: hypothetical protein M1839_005582 [Geoglossum umbratile]|nr:MAG: hypothetical protein M1839_005582 [Geoglossum umbratile]
MSNYVYNVPPPYQNAGAALQRAQSVQYNYQQQPPPGAVPGGPPGGIATGTAASAPQNSAGNQYQYQAPTSFNSPSPPQGQWGNPPSQQQPWKPPGPSPSALPAPAAAYNPGAYGPMPGSQQTPNSPTRYNTGSTGLGQGAAAGYNQNVQNQGYGYGAVPQQPASAPPQQQYQNQPPSSQQWSQSQNPPPQQQAPPPPLPVRSLSLVYVRNVAPPIQTRANSQNSVQPRPASVIGNNRPTSVIYAPQNQLHSSPVQANAQLPQQTQTPQQHQSPYATPQLTSQTPQSQQQQPQPNYYGQYQNQNQAPAPPPPKPQGYQQDGGQNQQQQPSTGYQYNQTQGQAQLQQQPSQYGQYDASAPPVPSKTSDGSYFPPVTQQPQQAQNNGQQYPPNQATDAGASPGAWESQPAHIPPSLSGHGVSAYQPSNANPQPGVYIPPPPENVPAWSQQQHAPLAPPPGAKRFKYTPPVLHPDYQPGGSKYNPQQVAQPAQPYQPNPTPQQQQEWTPQPIEAQYPGQPGVEGWNQQVGGWQPISHGDVPGVAPGLPPEQQASWGQQQDPLQGQNHQQQQNQQYQQPQQEQLHQQQQNQQYQQPQQEQLHQQQQNQQYQQPQQEQLHQQQQSWREHQNQQYHYAQQPLEQQQPAQTVPAGIHTQSQPSQHQPHVSLSQAYENAHKHDAQRPPAVTPPVQATASPPSQSPNAAQTHSEGKDANKKLVSSNALSASALGFGGPGDWEHFGLSAEDESVDDTALTAKKEEPVTPAQNSVAELPSDSSPTMPKATRQNFHEPEAWPSPPALAPLAMNGPLSTSASAVHDGTRYTPTPPPNNVLIYPQPERTASVVSVEDHGQGNSIDSAMQTWTRQQSQVVKQQHQGAESQHTPRVPDGSQSFVMDNEGRSNPAQQNKSTVVPPDREQSRTPTQAQYPQQQRPQEDNKSVIPAPGSQSFVMDEGFSGQLHQHEPIASASTSQTPKSPTEVKVSAPLPAASQSFVMDDGGWPAQTQAHESPVSAQVSGKPRAPDQTKPVPASSQSFVVDDGGGWSVQVQQPDSHAKAPSSQQPLVPGAMQPTPASNVSLTLGDRVPSSQPPQRGEPSSSNTAHSQPSPKRQVAPEPVDPYPNLDPWYKASLERYAAMVSAESLAATDEERTKLFTDFMMEESRLRGVRYGVGIGVGPKDDKRKSGGSNTSASQKQPTTPPRGRQLPKPVSTDSLPNDSDDDIQYSPGGRPRIRSQSATAKARNTIGVSELRQESGPKKSQLAATPPQKYAVAAPPKPIDQPLSPGGNAPIPIESTEPAPSRTVVHAPSSPPSKPGIRPQPITQGSPKSTGSAPDSKPAYIPFRPVTEGPKAPMESLYKPYIPPSASFTTVKENQNYKPVSATNDTKSSKPAYVPFVPPFPVDTSPSTNYSNARGPPIQRKTSLDSAPQKPRTRATNEHVDSFSQGDGNGKATGHGKAVAPLPRRRDTTDIATVRNKTDPVKREHFETLPEPSVERGKPSAGKMDVSSPSQGGDIMARLERILPSNRGPKADGSIYIAPMIKCMDSLPDELNFISDAIAAWDVKAKKVRETHDRERRVRQEEQEEHTDQLFSENQIGYGDISALEEDFKLSEREKKSKEDKEEYESFVSEVFARSYDHFQEEIKQLMDHYVGCMDLMKDIVAGKEALEAHTDKPNLSQIMAVFVVLHKKIEMRHEAVIQVVMERDKRFKKTVIQPLYSAGNIPEVKKMEKHFDEADKKSALEAARKKDQRAKRFMHSIEENTMKTLREDLGYMDEIMQEIHKILQVPPPSLTGNYPRTAQALSNELVFAQTTLKILASKSEDLMQSFYTAALEINAAEYGVSHATARLNNESSDITDRLRADMIKENDRLAKELEHRTSAVKGDFQKVNEEVLTLLQRLEKLKVAATAEQGAQGSPNAVDPEYDARMVKALEAAKKRNAGKGGGPEDFS